MWVKVPPNMVELSTPLAEKQNWSIRDQLLMGVAVYKILGIDSTKMNLSLAGTWRQRRRRTSEVASDTLEEAAKEIKEENAMVFVKF